MNYRKMLRGALAFSLSLIVGPAMAVNTTTTDIQKYGATFESTVNTTVGELNDYAYELGTNVTKYAVTGGNSYGWFGAEGDESKIIAANGGQALQLNTDAGTLTNKLESTIKTQVNAGIAAAGAYIETEAKFVASDTLDAGVVGGADDTKFAIYAYADESKSPCTTNLVVYHAYYDGNGDLAYTNEVFDTLIDCDIYTKLRVEMKKMTNPANGQPVNVFSVKVGNSTALTSENTFDAYLDEELDEGIWFLTVEEPLDDNNKLLSTINFKGTGEVDNLSVGIIQETTTYAIDWSASQGVIASNLTDNVQLAAGETNFANNVQLAFYPTEGNVITNVLLNGTQIDGVMFPIDSYTYTVNAADAIVTVLAGVEAAPPAPTVISVAQTVGAHGGSVSNGNFQAVAGVATPITITADQGYVIAQIVTNGAPVANALGETAVTFDAVFSGEEGANNSIVATFAKADAWFVDPFIRNKFASGRTTENTQASALDEVNGVVAFGTAPGNSTAGIVQYGLAEITNDFGKITVPVHAESYADNLDSYDNEFWGRSFASVAPYQTFVSCNYNNSYVYASPYGGPWWGTEDKVSYTIQFDMGESGLAAPHLYPITVNRAGTFLYGTDTAGSKIYKFAIVADTQDNTKIGSLQYVASWDFTGGGDLKGIGVGTFNGNDVVYMGKNASRGLWILDVATGTLTKTAAPIDSEVYQLYTTGMADGTPRLVVGGGANLYVYDLNADGTLLATTPVFNRAVNTLTYSTSGSRFGTTPLDDDSRIVLANYNGGNIGISVVEKKPANLIVRGTFDQGVTTDDRSVAFGAAASETFMAPAGETLISVSVNGVAQQVADGATSFTYEAAELTEYVYIDMQSSPPVYTATWTGSQDIIVTNTYDGVSYEMDSAIFSTDVLQGTVLSFYPTEGNVITNVTIGGVEQTGFDPACYSITVISDTNIVVLAGVSQPIGRIKPEWAADADTTKFWNWVDNNNVSDYASVDYTTEYLLNTAVGQDPAPAITITSITVGATATTIEVRGTVGRGLVNFANLNGVLNVAVGSSVTALTPKAIPAANLDTSVEGVATITIPNADGCFFRARVDFAAPQASLTAVSE